MTTSRNCSVAAVVSSASALSDEGEVLMCSRGRMAFHTDHMEDRSNRIYIYFCAEKNVSKAAMKK